MRARLLRQLIFLFLLITLTLPATSQGGGLRSAQQPDLNSLIDSLQKKYSRMNGLAADFQQIYQGNDGRTIRESGRLYLKKPGKARWEYLSPEKKIFICDGKNIYFHVFGERQATKASVRESSDPQIPFLFLLGRGDLRKDFSRIEMLSNERAVESGNTVLRLVPKKAPAEFNRLLVEVNPQTAQVHRLVIMEKNGTRMDFLLTNARDNFAAPDSLFHFTPPPGVAVKSP